MTWIAEYFTGHGVGQALVALSLAVTLGLALGRASVRGISLGVGGVLFSGLLLAHLGVRVDADILEFTREFGLILFVFSVGMQVGPGFVDSLRRRGLILNLAAALIVILGGVTAACAFYLFGLSPAAAVGLLSGAVTNTPSLAAASHVLAEVFPNAAGDLSAEAGMAYAVAYPFGILGIILCMLLVRIFFRIKPAQELEDLKKLDALAHPPLKTGTFEVSNPNIFGMRLGDFLRYFPSGLVVSRIKEPGEAVNHGPAADTVMSEGTLVHVVGQDEQLEKIRMLLGPESGSNLHDEPGPLSVRSLLVTKSHVAGKSIQSLGLSPESGITVTRIGRAGIEFTARPGTHLHYGDKLLCVGEQKDLDRAEATLGNSARALDHPHVLPIFLGILLGIGLGSIPFSIPGLPYAVKLGLAGGPLLAAIALSRINHFAGMIWYLPMGANLILREVGIALFLACVGLKSGGGFVEVLTHGEGLLWMVAGACITFFPLAGVACLARIVLRYDYASICGLLAGSMTDPPALAFSVQMLDSDAPSSVYASVYPLTMILRILSAQLLVLALFYFS